jgi:hypothetical protein
MDTNRTKTHSKIVCRKAITINAITTTTKTTDDVNDNNKEYQKAGILNTAQLLLKVLI